MKFKSFFFVILFLSNFKFGFVLQAQIKFDFKTENAFGKTYNVYCTAPSYLNDSTLLTKADLYTNAVFLKNEVDFKFTKSLKKSHKLILNTQLENTSFNKERLANSHATEMSLEHYFNLSKKLSLSNTIGVEKSRILTINMSSDDGVAAYDFKEVRYQNELKYRINKSNLISLENRTGYKDYLTMPSNNNFTHFYHTHKLGYELRFKRNHYLNFDTYYHKQFFQTLYYTSDINDGLVTWTYLDFRGTYKYKIDKNKYIKPFIRYNQKIDGPLGDYAFRVINYGVTFDWTFKKIGIMSTVDYNDRLYSKRLAYIESKVKFDTTPLNYKYFTTNFRIYYSPNQRLNLFINIYRENRTSNTIRLDKKFRRPYETYSISFGLKYSFSKVLKIKPK
jgi:hypothetical protein